MSQALVVDCSVSGAWLLEDERTGHAERLLGCVLSGELRLVEPELWRYEMLNLLRTAVLRGRMTEREARRALVALGEIPVELVPAVAGQQAAILGAALVHELSVYDAAYLAVAESRGAELVTADEGLLRLRSGLEWVRTLEEFCRDLPGG